MRPVAVAAAAYFRLEEKTAYGIFSVHRRRESDTGDLITIGPAGN